MAKPNNPTVIVSVNELIESAVQKGPAVDKGPEDGALLRIDLDEIGPHPDQPRRTLNEEKLKELMAAIVQSGELLQPINVRPSLPTDAREAVERSFRYRLITGQRRLESYRRLRDGASSDEERRRYATIPAVLRLGRDKAAALQDAIVENLQRDDLLPLDAAEALAKLKKEAGYKSAKDLAAAVGQKEDRVKRLLRLNDAPEVVKLATRSGLMIEVAGADGATKREHLRRLDLMEALEFAQLHEALLKKLQLIRKPAVAEEQADDRTRRAIGRALRDGWGFRRIQEYVGALIEGRVDEAEKPAKAAPAPFKASASELTIRRNALAGASAAQLDELEQHLRTLLAEVVKTKMGNVAHASSERA